MRARGLVAVVLLTLPALASAQRIPTSRPGRGTMRPDVPPQAPTIARELSYVRLPYSAETYPFVSTMRASWGDGLSSWTSGGVGQRLDVRVHRYASLTLDLTASFFGGPIMTRSAEVGTRIQAGRGETRRLHPFLDLRAGYVYSNDSYANPFLVHSAGPTAPSTYGFGYSHGVGAVVGAGAEYTISRMFSLVANVSRLGTTQNAFRFMNGSATRQRFELDMTRYQIGVRFNPVRYGRGTAPPKG